MLSPLMYFVKVLKAYFTLVMFTYFFYYFHYDLNDQMNDHIATLAVDKIIC